MLYNQKHSYRHDAFFALLQPRCFSLATNFLCSITITSRRTWLFNWITYCVRMFDIERPTFSMISQFTADKRFKKWNVFLTWPSCCHRFLHYRLHFLRSPLWRWRQTIRELSSSLSGKTIKWRQYFRIIYKSLQMTITRWEGGPHTGTSVLSHCAVHSDLHNTSTITRRYLWRDKRQVGKNCSKRCRRIVWDKSRDNWFSPSMLCVIIKQVLF